MVDINENLQKMLNARYGKDVRQTIHDSIKQINDKVENIEIPEAYDDTQLKEEIKKNMLSKDDVESTIKDFLAENPVEGGSGEYNDATECTFYVEDKYYACVGAEFNIFYDNICTMKNRDNIIFSASASGKATIKTYPDCFRINPTSDMAGTTTITVKATNAITRKILAETSFSIEVIAKQTFADTVKLMCIGDSLTNGGWQNTLLSLMSSNFALYGTLKGTKDTYLHEGRVSWKSSDYCNVQTYNTLTNPFYNPDKSGTFKFDFAYYMQKYPQFADVNYVNIMLGRNDGYALSAVDNIKKIVDNIKGYNPNIIITLCLSYHLGFAPDEANSTYYSYTVPNTTYNFNKRMHEVFDSYEKVYLVPAFVGIHNSYSHGLTDENYTGRLTGFKRKVITDRVHFSPYGYQQIADAYYPVFQKCNKLYPVSAPTTPPTENENTIDKTNLDAAITNAQTNLTSVAISVDGTDVLTTKKWVTQAVYDTYNNAITIATNTKNSEGVTEDDVNNAITALVSATTIFDDAKSDGTKTAELDLSTVSAWQNSDYKAKVCYEALNDSSPKYVIVRFKKHATYENSVTKFDGNSNGIPKINLSGQYCYTDTFTSDDGINWTKKYVNKNLKSSYYTGNYYIVDELKVSATSQWKVVDSVGLNTSF